VSLIDIACSPANRPGLEALRDVVASLEAVSTRVTALEHGGNFRYAIADLSPSPRSPSPQQGDGSSSPMSRLGACSPGALRSMDARVSARVDARLDKLEQSLPAMHDRLHESLLVLWSAVREISREICTSGTVSGGSAMVGRMSQLPQRAGSPQRSPRTGFGNGSRRNVQAPHAAFRDGQGRGGGGTI
jgi:hypothetical protein